MCTLYRVAFCVDTKRSPIHWKKPTTTVTTARDWNKSFTHMEHRTGAVSQEGFVNLTFQSLLLNIFFRVSWLRSSPLLIHVPGPLYTTVQPPVHTTPKCGTEPIYVTLHFLDRRCAASLRYRNCAEIIVLMCERNHGLRSGMVWK